MWSLLWSPGRFFAARLHRPPRWGFALGGPALCAGLQSVSAYLFSAKTRPLVDAALATLDLPLPGLPSERLLIAMSVLTYPMFFALLTLAVLAIDVLLKDSRQPAHLTEFTALSFYTQVPFCLVMIVIAWAWAPEPMRLPAGSAAELLSATYRYRDAMQAGPLLSTGRLLSYYSLLWLAAVLSLALQAVAGLSTRATVAAAAVLLAVCASGPLLRAAAQLLP